jgi:phosphoglycerate-specific signal transduction histidine kinase
VEQGLVWLQDSLKNEIDRRQEEAEKKQQEQEGQDGDSPSGSPPEPLVPDVAELRLLKRMEEEVLKRIRQMIELHPELRDSNRDHDPLVLEDLGRLAYQHQRIVELFKGFRERLGMPAPGETSE